MVYLYLADGFEEIEAITPLDIMRRAGIEVKTVGVNAELVKGTHEITIKADLLPEDVDIGKAEAIVLPGGMPGMENLYNDEFVRQSILSAARTKAIVAAICASPSILGRLGLLNGRKATCFPGFEEELKGAHVIEKSVVFDGNIITAKGAGCASEFGFELVRRLKGENVSKELYSSMQYA